jgi:hypothetical protein
MPAKTVIQLRRDTSTNWDSVNPILSAGEAGFETDTSKLKIGDGSTAWSSLAYFGNLDSLNNVGDVTITSAATGEVLRFDGTAWVNETLVIADVDGLQGALDQKATTDSPTFTGTIDASQAKTRVSFDNGLEFYGEVSGETGVQQTIYPSPGGTFLTLPGVSGTLAITSQLDGKSPLAGSTSITTVGTVTNATSPTALDSKGLRNITISTSAPSGGASGDLWFTT